MNLGGFSWRRLIGISAFKSRVSRKIGIPLTASGRRRKLGASVFNVVGSVAGTLAAAAATAAKQEKSNRATLPSLPKSPSLKGVYFCEVKGVTHNNDDGTSRIAAQQLCSVGDTVRLVPEPSNIHDRNAIRVLLQTGQQIGYISARQTARFKGRVHLLTATVHSRVKDEWGNDTVKLRVSSEQKVYEASTAPSVTAIQAEATKTVAKEGWQAALVYFENTGQRLYKVVKAEDAEAINQSLQEGMVQVGFIGLTDTPTGIKFAFSLNDDLPTDGIIAKRFLVNAREWVVTESKSLCARRGDPPPVVGEFQPSRNFQLSERPTPIKLVLISLVIVIVIFIVIAIIGGYNTPTPSQPAEQPRPTDAEQFSAMTPSDYLAEVKKLLTKAKTESKGQKSELAAINADLQQARKHKAAIPKGTPEYVQAVRAIGQIERLTASHDAQ